MAKPILYMLVGVPCAGKSTWIEKQNFDPIHTYIASTDNLLEDLAAREGKTYNDVFAEHVDWAHKQMNIVLGLATDARRDIVWDQTNLTRKSRVRKLLSIPESYHKIAVVFPTPDEETLAQRLDSRPGKYIPVHVMKSMKESFEFPTADEGFDEIWIRCEKVGDHSEAVHSR